MPFAEALKKEIRRRAHFRCCLCQQLGVEIHHILPESEDGPSTEDNAAPLCPSCHEIYGDNPKKRKFIREVRDHWYEQCESRSAADSPLLEALSRLSEGVATAAQLDSLRSEVLEMLTQGFDSLRKEFLAGSSDSKPSPKVEYLLDSSIFWIFLDAEHPAHSRVLQRIRSVPVESIAISAITIAEIYRAILSTRDRLERDSGAPVDRLLKRLDQMFEEIPVVSMSPKVARMLAELRSVARRESLSNEDLLLAAYALADGRVLVTADRDLLTFAPLVAEDWTAEE